MILAALCTFSACATQLDATALRVEGPPIIANDPRIVLPPARRVEIELAIGALLIPALVDPATAGEQQEIHGFVEVEMSNDGTSTYARTFDAAIVYLTDRFTAITLAIVERGRERSGNWQRQTILLDRESGDVHRFEPIEGILAIQPPTSAFVSSPYGGRYEYRALQNLLSWATLRGNLNDGTGFVSLTSSSRSMELPSDEVSNVQVHRDGEQRQIHFQAQEIQHEIGVYGRPLGRVDPTTAMIYPQTIWPGGMDVLIELDERGRITRSEVSSSIVSGTAEYMNEGEVWTASCLLKDLVRLTQGVDRIITVDGSEPVDSAPGGNLGERLRQLLDCDGGTRPAGQTVDLTTIIDNWLLTLEAPESAHTYLRQVLDPLTTLPLEHRLLDDDAVSDIRRILSNFEAVYSTQTELEWAQHSIMLRWSIFHRLRLSRCPVGIDESNEINRDAATIGTDMVDELKHNLAAQSRELDDDTAARFQRAWERNVADMADGDGLMLAVAARTPAWRRSWLQRAAKNLVDRLSKSDDLEATVQHIGGLVQVATIKAFESDAATEWEIDPFGIATSFMWVSLDPDGYPRCLFSGPIGWVSSPLASPPLPNGCGECNVCERMIHRDD